MTRDTRVLYAGAAGAVLVALGLGYGFARITGPKPVAVSEEATAPATANGAIAMTAAEIVTSQIKVETVAAGGVDAEILAPGTVSAAPGGQAVLTAGAAGTVTRIYKRLGEPVRAGETVATLVSRDAAAIAAERGVAQAHAQLARQQAQREQRLFEQGVSARQDYEIAQANQLTADAQARAANLAAGAARVSADGRSIAVVSAVSGRLTAAPATLGAYVQPETELFRVTDPAKVQIEASVAATDIGRIQVGGRARVITADGRALEARVVSVTPGVSATTRQATAVLAVSGGETLAPGQMVRTQIFALSADEASGVTVPQNAVQTIAGKEVVFLRTANGFRAQPVKIVRRSAGLVQLATGVPAGASIATDNAFLLKAELGKNETED
jgi:cobalt-zinc-cadmium efflux system membrane fusion protein